MNAIKTRAELLAAIKATKAGRPLVIDYTASWCGPCKAAKPHMARLAAALPDIDFVTVDVDEVPSPVSSVPTFAFCARGRCLGEQAGWAGASAMRAQLVRFLAEVARLAKPKRKPKKKKKALQA